MNSKLSLLISLFLFPVFLQRQHIARNYIEFIHIGQEDHAILPKIISTTEVNLPLSSSDSDILKNGFKAKTIGRKEKSLFQKLVVTDEYSYNKLLEFINHNRLRYFCSLQSLRNRETGTFKVLVEGNTYYLNSVNSWKFFEDVHSWLKLNKCDQKLTKAMFPAF